MSDEKEAGRVNLNCPVDAEFAAEFDAHWKSRGGKNRGSYIRGLIKADMAALAPEGPTPPPDIIAALRRELAVLAYLLLSAAGRIGSSEAAAKLVEGYLSGALHAEVHKQ